MIDRLNAALEGRYTVHEQIGEGGMSIVYLADDLKHNRKVALKVLKPELAAVVGAERFLAEIETTANLQHPHILPLFDSGEADGFLFFVMPFIDGETLADKLEREKQLPVDEAVGIATAVASALSVAHEQGVIHRDIKPGNVLLSRGEPLVSDFGIAIAVTSSSGARLTETGLSVGTPYYMSPEQATGDREVTAASDVYSLGCVLYEMLVGEPPYVGTTAQAVLGKILTEKPRDPSKVRSVVPPHVEGAVMRALEKLPADRFRSASGFVRALQDSGFRYGTEKEDESRAGGKVSPGWRIGGLAASVVALAALAFGAFGGGSSSPSGDVMRLDLSMGTLQGTEYTDPAISPDGTMIAVTAMEGNTPAIYLRRIGEADFNKIPGTEGGEGPSFSPDNRWIVFRDQDRDVLVRVSPEGGGALTLAKAEGASPYFPHWAENGTIVHSGPTGTYLVSPAGEIRPVVSDLGRRPFLLPDGSGVLGAPGSGGVRVWLAENDSTVELIPEGRFPTYLNSGHILYVSAEGGLYAQPFDLDDHTISGTPVRVLDRVNFSLNARGYVVSASGALLHREGDPTISLTGEPTRFVLVDGEEMADTVPLPPGSRQEPRFSPDGRFLAYEYYSAAGSASEIHTFDLVTGYEQPLTFGGDNEEPVWSPDGQELLFDVGLPEAGEDLHRKWADNRAPEKRVLELPQDQNALEWTEGDTILFETFHGGAGPDLFLLDLNGDGEPVPFLQSPWLEMNARLSPDRALVALQSDETGDAEIWLRTFPDPTGKWRVSTGGGFHPRWAPDGSGVYFWTGEGPEDRLMFAGIEREPSVRVAPPREVLKALIFSNADWDVHPDGGRFLITVPAQSPAVSQPETEISSRYLFVLNWMEELERRLEEAR